MLARPSEPGSQTEFPERPLPYAGLRRFLALRRADFLGGEPSSDGSADPLSRGIAFLGRFDLALVAAFTALLYTINYLNFTFPQVPWFGWYDQGEYFKTAHDLAVFKFGESVYPLGYPVLGALFIRLLPGHAFFLPNLFCTVGIALLFYCAARQLVTKVESAALTGLAVIAQTYVWVWTLTVPWNVIPVAFVAYLCVYLIVFQQPTVRTMRICGVGIAAAFFCRPWDAFFLCILYAGGLYVLGTWRERFRAVAVLVGSVTFVALLLVTDYMVVFGKPYSPYMRGLASQGMSFAHYPFKVYQIFLDSNVIGTSVPSSVLDKMPWLVLIVPGAMLLIRRYGVPAIAWFVAATTMTGFYLSANGMIPSQFWDYWGCRYIACWAPFSVLLAYLSVTRAWRILGWKTVCGGFAATFLLLIIIGWRPLVVAQWKATASSTTNVWTIKTQMIDKSLFVHVQFLKPTTLDGLRLRFDRGLMVPMESAISTRATVKADGRPLITPWREVVVHQEKDSGTLTVFFVNSRVSERPVSQLDLKFDGIDNDTLTTITAIRAQFHPFAYLSHTYDKFAEDLEETEVTAYLLPTPWDLTGSAAGVPDGQMDYAVDCKLPSDARRQLADMEIDLHSGNLGGRWATHSRGMNWDKLVFMPGYVEENLRDHPPITNLADILHRGGKFTILFKLPDADRGLPLTLVGLDREGREVFEKEMAGVK
jgi:hypothetical protein